MDPTEAYGSGRIRSSDQEKAFSFYCSFTLDNHAFATNHLEKFAYPHRYSVKALLLLSSELFVI